MQDNDLELLLKQALLSEGGPELSETVIKTILVDGAECEPEALSAIHKRFTQKLFLEAYPQPIRQVDAAISFADFLETRRTEMKLRTIDVAVALDMDVDAFDRLERGNDKPWKLGPEVTVRIMDLFRLHFDAVKRLVQTSLNVSGLGGVGYVSARSRGGIKDDTRGRSTMKALERFYAANKAASETPDELSDWLLDLERAAEEEGLKDLLPER